ncbi:hypothetical protein B566_EDAN018132, partial [Ephemera danica]
MDFIQQVKEISLAEVLKTFDWQFASDCNTEISSVKQHPRSSSPKTILKDKGAGLTAKAHSHIPKIIVMRANENIQRWTITNVDCNSQIQPTRSLHLSTGPSAAYWSVIGLRLHFLLILSFIFLGICLLFRNFIRTLSHDFALTFNVFDPHTITKIKGRLLFSLVASIIGYCRMFEDSFLTAHPLEDLGEGQFLVAAEIGSQLAVSHAMAELVTKLFVLEVAVVTFVSKGEHGTDKLFIGLTVLLTTIKKLISLCHNVGLRSEANSQEQKKRGLGAGKSSFAARWDIEVLRPPVCDELRTRGQAVESEEKFTFFSLKMLE